VGARAADARADAARELGFRSRTRPQSTYPSTRGARNPLERNRADPMTRAGERDGENVSAIRWQI
jgi:hypothetical protein